MSRRSTYTKRDLLSIAALTASLQVDGHRADLVILKAARAHAAFEGRTQLTERDIALAAELALPHRMRRARSTRRMSTPSSLQERIEQVQSEFAGADEQDAASTEDRPERQKKETRTRLDREGS